MKKLSSLLLVLLLFGVLGSSNLLALAPPTTQAGYLNFTLQESEPSEVPLSFVRGNGTNRLVVISTSAFTTEEPTDDISYFAPASGDLADVTDEIDPGYYVIGNLSGTNQTMTLKGLAEGTTYYVKVFEYNTNGTDYSYNNAAGVALNPRDFTTLFTIDGPILVGTDQIKTVSARMTWDALAEVGAGDYYNLYLNTTNNFTGVTPINVGDTDTWVENGLDDSTTYYWKVRAVIDGYEYANPRVESFTTLTAPVIQIVSITTRASDSPALPNPPGYVWYDEDMIIGEEDGEIAAWMIEIRFNQPMEPSSAPTWEFGANNPLTDGIFDLADYTGTWITVSETNDTYQIIFSDLDQTIPVDYCVDVNVTAVETADGVRDWDVFGDVHQVESSPGSGIYVNEKGKTNVFCIDTEVPTFEITYERTSPNATTTPKWVKDGDMMKITATFSEPMDISYLYSINLDITTIDATIDFSVVPDTDNMIFTAEFEIDDAIAEQWVEALAVDNGQDVNGNTLSVANNNLVPEGGTAGDDAALILDNVEPADAVVTFPATANDNPVWFKFGAGNSTLNQTIKTVTGTVTDGNMAGLAGLTPPVNGGILYNEFVLFRDVDGSNSITNGDQTWNAATQTWDTWTSNGEEVWNPANGNSNWNFTFPTIDTYANTTPDGSYIFYSRGTDLAYNVNPFATINGETIETPTDDPTLWAPGDLMQIWLDNTAPILSIDEPLLTDPVQMFNAEASGTPGSIYDVVVDGLVTEQGSGLYDFTAEIDLPHLAPGDPFVVISGFADLNSNMMHDVGEPFFQMIDAITYGFMSTTERLYSAEVQPTVTPTGEAWELSAFQVGAITDAMVTYALANSQADMQFVLTAKVRDGVGHTTTKKTAVRLDAKPPVGDVTYYVQKQGIGDFELKTDNFHVRDMDVVRIDADFNEDMDELVPVEMDDASALWSPNPRTLARVDAQNYTHDWLVDLGGSGVSDFTFVSGEDMYGNIVDPAIAGGKGTWVTVDNQIPLLSIVTPDPRANIDEAILLNQYQPTAFDGLITGTASDALPGQLKHIKIRIFRDMNRNGEWDTGEPFFVPVVDPDFPFDFSNTAAQFDGIDPDAAWLTLPAVANWTVTLPTADGFWSAPQRNNRTYVVDVYSEDLAGNVSHPDPNFAKTAFVIDDTPPVITVNTPIIGTTPDPDDLDLLQGPIVNEVNGITDFVGLVFDANRGTIADIQITLYYDANCNGYNPGEGDGHFDGTDYTTIATISVDPTNISETLPWRETTVGDESEVTWNLDAALPYVFGGLVDGCYMYQIDAYDQAGNTTTVNGFWVLDQNDPTATVEHTLSATEGIFDNSLYPRVVTHVRPGANVDAVFTFNEFIVEDALALPTVDYTAALDSDYDLLGEEIDGADPETKLPPYTIDGDPGNWYLQDQEWYLNFTVPTLGSNNDQYTITGETNIADLAGNASLPMSIGSLYIDDEMPEADITLLNGAVFGGTTNWNFGPNRALNTFGGTSDDGAAPDNSGIYGVQLSFELISQTWNGTSYVDVLTGWFWDGDAFVQAYDNTDEDEANDFNRANWGVDYWFDVNPNGAIPTPYSTWTFNDIPDFGDDVSYVIAVHIRTADWAENVNSSLVWYDLGSETPVGGLAYEIMYWDAEAPIAEIWTPTDNILISAPMSDDISAPNKVMQVGASPFSYLGGVVSDAFTTTDIQVAVRKLTDDTDTAVNLWWDEVTETFIIGTATPNWFAPDVILDWDENTIDLLASHYSFNHVDGTDFAQVWSDDDDEDYLYWSIETIILDDDSDDGLYEVVVRAIDRANNTETNASAQRGYFELVRVAPSITSIVWTGYSYPGTPTDEVWYKDGDELTVTTTYDQAMLNSRFTLSDGVNDLFTNEEQFQAGPNNVWEYPASPSTWTVLDPNISGTYTYSVGTTSENTIGKQAESDLTGVDIITMHVDNDNPYVVVNTPAHTSAGDSKASPLNSIDADFITGTADDETNTWSSGIATVEYTIQVDGDDYLDNTGALVGSAHWFTADVSSHAPGAGIVNWTSDIPQDVLDVINAVGTEGTYIVTSRVEDNVGNTWANTDEKFFTVDNKTPVLTLTTTNGCGASALNGELNNSDVYNGPILVDGDVTDHLATTLEVTVQTAAGYLQSDLLTWGASEWLDELVPSTTPASGDGVSTVTTGYEFTTDLYDALNDLITVPTDVTVTVRTTDEAGNESTETCTFNFMPVHPEGYIDFIVGGTSIIQTIDVYNTVTEDWETHTFASAKSGTNVDVVSNFFNPLNSDPQNMNAVSYDYTGVSTGTNAATATAPTPSGWTWTYATPSGDGITTFEFTSSSATTRDEWGNPVGDVQAQNLPEGELIIDNTDPDVCDIEVETYEGVTTLAHEHEAKNTVKLKGTIDEIGFVKDLYIAVRNININKFWQGEVLTGKPGPFYSAGTTVDGTVYPPIDGRANMNANTLHWIEVNDVTLIWDGSDYSYEWEIPFTLTEFNEDGVYHVYVYAEDYAGNITNTFSTPSYGGGCNEIPEFRLDNTAPVITLEEMIGDIENVVDSYSVMSNFNNYYGQSLNSLNGIVTDNNGNTVELLEVSILQTGVRIGEDDSEVGHYWDGSSWDVSEYFFTGSPTYLYTDGVTNQSYFSWDVDISSKLLTSGYYTVCLYATDLAGNRSLAQCYDIEVDTTPPTVTILSPGNFTNDIPANLPFASIQFSEELQVETVSTSLEFTLYEYPSGDLIRTWDMSEVVFVGPNEVRLPLTPGDLEEGTWYWITTNSSGTTNDIRDLVGNQWDANELYGTTYANSKWKFQTSSDTEPPVMEILVDNGTDWIDVNGSSTTGVRRDQNIRVQFDEKVRKSNGFSYTTGSAYVNCGLHRYNTPDTYYELIDANGPNVEMTVTVGGMEVAFTDFDAYFAFNGSSGAEDEIVIEPTVLLEANTTYTVYVSGNIVDYAGNAISPSLQSGSFTTGSAMLAVPVLNVTDLVDGACYNDDDEFSVTSTSVNPGVYSEVSTDGTTWAPFVMGATYDIADFFMGENGTRTLYFRDAHCANDGYANAEVTFTVDNTLPIASVTYIGADPTNVAPMAFEVEVTEANAYTFDPSTGLTVTNGAYASHTVVGNVYTVNVTPDSPSPQTGHTVTVELLAGAIVDCADNASTVTPSDYGVYDDVAPVITIDAPLEFDPMAPTANGYNASFEYSTTETLAIAEYSWNGTNWYTIPAGMLTIADLTGTGAPDADGTYTLYVRGEDAAGNEATADVTFVIDVTPPEWCAGLPLLDPGYTVTKTKAAVLAGLDEAGTVYYIVQEATMTAPTAATIFSSGSTFIPLASDCDGDPEDYQIELTGLTAGTDYVVYLIAEDYYGNQQVDVETVEFTTMPVPAPHSNLYVAGRTLSTITLKWTKTTDSDVFIVARQGSAVSFDEDALDGNTYNADADFASGDELDMTGDGNFVIYAGSGNIMTVRQLSANTVYHFALYAVSTDGNLIYNTGQKLTISQRTLRKEGIEDEGTFGTPSLSISNLRPNPATTDLTFDLEVFEQTNVKVEVINAAGQVVAIPIVSAQYGDGIYPIQIVLDSEKVASGAYYLKVTANGSEIAIAPFSVVR